MLLEVDSLSYRYRIGNREVPVLDGITFAVEEGEFVAIQGPSGSGKSTLFYLLGGLLRPRSGDIRLDGEELGQLSRDGLALLRNRKVGFVFQQFHLLPGASVLENILLPCRFPLETAQVTEADVARAHELARELGIHEHVSHLPNQLSGGQQQRVAIARALMRDVKLILADEPTGALDSRSAAQTMELLKGLNAMGKTVVIITHDNEIAAQCRRVLRVRDGRLESDSAPPPARATQTERKSAPVARAEWRGPLGLARAVIPSALRNLLRNRAKSLLTMLGVIIGVAAVLSMITLGNFTKRRILESYENLGVNRLGVAGYPNWRLRASELVGTVFRAFDVERDLLPLKRVFPQIRLISPVLRPWRSTTVSGGGHTVSDQAEMMGVGEEHFAISNWNVAKGLPINSFHVENRSPVCLLGSELSDRLFTGTEAVGNFVTADMGGGIVIPCRVIGVLAARTSNQQWDKPNMTMMMPYSYLRVWFPQVHNVTIQAKPGTDIEKTQASIKAYFERKYGKTGSFYVDSDAALVDQMKRFLGLFTLLLASIAALALLVGGIGINNMMLVSISERVREFGLRKALGATDRSLRFQVIGESMLLCLAAGLIGAAGGFLAYEGIIYGVSRVVPKVKFEWVFEPWAVALSAFSMVAVGLLSGLVPALKAQKLEVIEALRSE